MPLGFHQTLSVFLLAGAVAAQCQFSTLTARSIGSHCNIGSTGCCALPGHPTLLVPTLNVTNCTVDVDVLAVEGCCSVVIPLRVLAIGFAPAATPLPQFGSTCTLWLAPTFVFDFTSSSVAVPIPPSLPPLTFYAQAGAVILDAAAPQLNVVTLTAAQAISLQ